MKNNLKLIRQEKGLTQVQIAEKANIAVRAYQNYEAGERMPKVNTALLIANILNSSVEELFPVTPIHKKTKKHNLTT